MRRPDVDAADYRISMTGVTGFTRVTNIKNPLSLTVTRVWSTGCLFVGGFSADYRRVYQTSGDCVGTYAGMIGPLGKAEICPGSTCRMHPAISCPPERQS